MGMGQGRLKRPGAFSEAWPKLDRGEEVDTLVKRKRFMLKPGQPSKSQHPRIQWRV